MFSAAGFAHALVRKPGPNVRAGLTTAALGEPDDALVLDQHAAYVATLRALGVEPLELDPLPTYPDAHFVEDTAVITPELAIITHMGAAARRGEEETVATALAHHRPLVYIEPPGTVDGGDVLVVESHCMIGLSERTNAAGAAQLVAHLTPHGYRCETIPLGAGLHLKSSVNYVGINTLLLQKEIAAHPAFAPYNKLLIAPDEAYAANTLFFNDSLLMPAGFAKTEQQLATLGFPLFVLETSELQKMDGGLTCLSLRW